MFIAASLILSVPEFALLLFGAIILGITIHFFITSRRSLQATTQELEKDKKIFARDEWKLRYLNDMELREKEISGLKHKLLEAEENVEIYTIESEEVRLQNQKLEAEIARLKKEPAAVQAIHRAPDKYDYLEQLRQAQSSLVDQNQKVNQILTHIELIREKEEAHRELLKDNAELSSQVNAMRMELSDREKEMAGIRQKEQMTKEMTSMLDNAYSEFGVLQSKIQKLESQLTSSRMMNLEYEDMKEEHSRATRELEEQRTKANALSNENQQLQLSLMDTEDKLREANFQRQQLQKRVGYLEELNNDLHVVSDANKKLEGQLRRIGELESMLNVVSEERDELVRGQDEQ